MGQEASLPADVVDDLDEQARAPPSYTNPPPVKSTAAGGGGSGTNAAPTGRSNGSRQGSKMLGSMFNRGNGGGGGGAGAGTGSSSQYNQNQAAQHGSENFESREIARAAASGGNLYLNDSSSEEFYNGNGVKQNGMPQQNSHAQDPQHHHHHPQQHHSQQHHPQQQPPPPPPHPPPNYPEQHQQQQYYDASGMPQQQQQHQLQHQHQQQQQAYYPPQQVQQGSGQHPQDIGDHGVESVMYEGKAPGKRGLSRASARGAALINSMRNLSLGGALRGGSKQQQQQQQQNQQSGASNPHEVTDWEKQWDEDDDDSEGEEDDPNALQQGSMGSASNQAAAGLPLHQIRPGMDAGHSRDPESQRQKQQELEQQQQHDVSLEFQQLDSPSAILPTTTAPLSPIKKQKANFVSPEMVSQQQKHQLAVQTGDLLSDPNVAVIPQDEWDAGMPGVEEVGNLKPNVQMFLPMLRVLGKGSFGKVVLVQKRVGKERGQLFAMKILRKTHLVKRRQIERTRTERKVLSVVNHPFIMKLHYAFQSHDKLYLVLDYCPGGELFFHLSRFRRFPERVARFYAAELLLAIGHLHKRGIIYRDLKPENVLLDADGHVKLGDFGLAKAGIRHPFEGAISMCGTPEYMAPEVLAQQGHGFCVDYWGLGMLVYEMMTGLPPWYTTDRAKLFRRLKSAPLDVPSYFSVQSASCVSELLDRDPRRRLGVTGIRTAMEHDFFRNISWRSLYARHVEAPIRPCEGWTPPEGAKEDLLDMGNGSSDMDASDIEKMGSHELEAATANFDNTFTRMPIESEDQGQDANSDEGDDELNEETFLGFTFDGKDPGTSTSTSSSSSRQRAHIYQTGSNQSPN